MRSYRWYIKFPLDAYAIGPIEFNRFVGEKEVREYARQFDGIKRLPRGFQCWPVQSSPYVEIRNKTSRR